MCYVLSVYSLGSHSPYTYALTHIHRSHPDPFHIHAQRFCKAHACEDYNEGRRRRKGGARNAYNEEPRRKGSETPVLPDNAVEQRYSMYTYRSMTLSHSLAKHARLHMHTRTLQIVTIGGGHSPFSCTSVFVCVLCRHGYCRKTRRIPPDPHPCG